MNLYLNRRWDRRSSRSSLMVRLLLAALTPARIVGVILSYTPMGFVWRRFSGDPRRPHPFPLLPLLMLRRLLSRTMTTTTQNVEGEHYGTHTNTHTHTTHSHISTHAHSAHIYRQTLLNYSLRLCIIRSNCYLDSEQTW